MTYAAITGWGKCMPPAVLTNADIATFLDKLLQFLAEHGIQQRAADGQIAIAPIGAFDQIPRRETGIGLTDHAFRDTQKIVKSGGELFLGVRATPATARILRQRLEAFFLFVMRQMAICKCTLTFLNELRLHFGSSSTLGCSRSW